MKKKYFYYSFMVSVVVFVSALFISCGSGPGDTDIGTTAAIKIEYLEFDPYYDYPPVVDPWPIPADGFSSIQIKVTLTDGSGEPVYVLTPVTFSTNLGHFPGGATSYSVETIDNSGIVYLHLIAGTTPGVAFFTCSSNNVTQAGYVNFIDWQGVNILGETAAITLTANPTSIPPDGISSTTITATLTDYIGEPVTTGTYVTFFTDSGKFPNNSTTYTMQTPDEDGIVSVSLIAGTGGSKANVCAYSNGVSQCIAVEYTRVE